MSPQLRPRSARPLVLALGAFAIQPAALLPAPTPAPGQALCRGAIGDRVWRDFDGDGLQDAGEPGLEGVALTLRDSSGLALETKLSDASGFYAFTRRCAGQYVVEIDPSTVPQGYVPSPCDAGTSEALDSKCSPATVVLASDQSTVRGVDFGFRLAGPGAIGDLVWLDSDCDGLQDFGTALVPSPEHGIPRVRVILRDDMGVIVAEATTNGSGRYSFTGLPDGRYFVSVDELTLPPGLLPAPCNPGLGDERDNDCSGVEVVLASGLSSELAAGLAAQASAIFDFGFRADPCGGTGCSRTYWQTHPHAWPAPFSPTTQFSAVFEDAFPGKTLYDVLTQTGTGLNALGRETVAALLNAASLAPDYALSILEVIALFDERYPAPPGSVFEYQALADYFQLLSEQSCPF